MYLKTFRVRDHYENEGTDLHDHIEEALRARLDSGGHASVTIKRSSGRGCPRVDLLGTSFWPDFDLSLQGDPVVAVASVTTTSATSSTVPNLPTRIKAGVARGLSRIISVSIKAGAMALTVMPSLANKAA